jgi:hypothetical protein
MLQVVKHQELWHQVRQFLPSLQQEVGLVGGCTLHLLPGSALVKQLLQANRMAESALIRCLM